MRPPVPIPPLAASSRAGSTKSPCITACSIQRRSKIISNAVPHCQAEKDWPCSIQFCGSHPACRSADRGGVRFSSRLRQPPPTGIHTEATDLSRSDWRRAKPGHVLAPERGHYRRYRGQGQRANEKDGPYLNPVGWRTACSASPGARVATSSSNWTANRAMRKSRMSRF